MQKFLASITFSLAFTLALSSCAVTRRYETNSPAADTERKTIAVADSFAFTLGDGRSLTQAKDTKDQWYNALDFGEDDHLGEDWNKNSGGNTDCGEPIYAIGNGEITYASDAGPGWGNVVIITHTLADGKKVQSLYGHMQVILKTSGEVTKREQIGSVGNANGKYLCHLHFEIREQSSPMWDKVGPGYSIERSGWVDPSEFIDSNSGKN